MVNQNNSWDKTLNGRMDYFNCHTFCSFKIILHLKSETIYYHWNDGKTQHTPFNLKTATTKPLQTQEKESSIYNFRDIRWVVYSTKNNLCRVLKNINRLFRLILISFYFSCLLPFNIGLFENCCAVHSVWRFASWEYATGLQRTLSVIITNFSRHFSINEFYVKMKQRLKISR